MYAMTACPWARGVHGILASSERKARDAAQILTDGLGLDGYSVIANLGENDRSATGFLAKDEFEATVDAFFAQPPQRIRGWEPAADAQARIVRAVELAVSQTLERVDIAIVGHGGMGTLLYCHLAGVAIQSGIGGMVSGARSAAPGFCMATALRGAGFARDALYLLRPDTYNALAEKSASPDALRRYFADCGLRL
jgi:hypothetical protein